jgi:hypothetical protein
MGMVMDLIAGDAREILLAISVDDWSGLRDSRRFAAYLPLGGRMNASWLDMFVCAVRDATGMSPGSFTEACCPLDDRPLARLRGSVDRTIERVDHHWVDDMAAVPDRALDAIAGRWIELIEFEECDVEADDKPMIRSVAGELLEFCRKAAGAEDVILAWTI